MGYRLECLFYRDIRTQPTLEEPNLKRRALQKQQNAMLELDSIIHRIMLYDLVGFCPFAMCVEFYFELEPLGLINVLT